MTLMGPDLCSPGDTWAIPDTGTFLIIKNTSETKRLSFCFIFLLGRLHPLDSRHLVAFSLLWDLDPSWHRAARARGRVMGHLSRNPHHLTAKWKPLENALGWDLPWLHDCDFMMPTVVKGQVFFFQ